MYVVAIKDTSAWAGDGPADLSMIGFWNLVVVWLKVSRSSNSRRPHLMFGSLRWPFKCLLCLATDPMAILPDVGVA
jgi:hypothetical protein